MTGTEGSCSFQFDDGTTLTIKWDDPYTGSNSYSASVSGSNAAKYTAYCTGGNGDNAQVFIYLYPIRYAEWMGTAAPTIGSKRLMDVMLPETHDSCTYGITAPSADSPDAPPLGTALKILSGVGGVAIIIGILTPLVGPVLAATMAIAVHEAIVHELPVIYAGWARAQDRTVTQQLVSGIRYLDLRVAYNPSDTSDPHSLYFCHGKYSIGVQGVLEQIAAFLQQHRKEVVILDFNHFYGMTAESHQALAGAIAATIGTSALAPNSLSPAVTLDTLWQASNQAIVLYDQTDKAIPPGFFQTYPYLWQDSKIRSKWMNVDNTTALVTDIDNELANKPAAQFWVMQAILTPDQSMIVKGLMPTDSYPGNLIAVAQQVTNQVVVGLIGQPSWQAAKVNIVIIDGYEDAPSYVGSIVNRYLS